MAATPQSMLKIVSSGLEDIERLNPPIGQPTLSFYKTVFKRRTRWASQWRRVEFDNLADFGRTATVTLPILGELITRAILVVELPDIVGPQDRAFVLANKIVHPFDAIPIKPIYPAWSWTNSIGNALCSQASFRIGNQLVDTVDSRLMETLDEQRTSIDHFDSQNYLLARDPTNFNPLKYNSTNKIDAQGVQTVNAPLVQTPIVQTPQVVQIEFPFWWNRGPGPQALPIQALAKDKVQISCTFRTAQQCVYTDYRTGYNPPLSDNEGAGPIPNIAGAGFYVENGLGTFITNYARDPRTLMSSPDVLATFVPETRMPTEYHFTDAYWVVEYVSLEDREAAAFRMADLQIPIEQHVAVPVTQTVGAKRVRVNLEQGGLVRDMTWVAQRVEATDYNAYFLFSRDLAAASAAPSEIPWWPNTYLPNWDFGDGYLSMGFADRRSDPFSAVTFWTNGTERFDHEGPSLFRSMIPCLNCKRTPLINRYIYRYDFGFWSSGGIAEALNLQVDEVRGFANWDKIAKKELECFINPPICAPMWSVQPIKSIPITGNSVVPIGATEGLYFVLQGAGGGTNGLGATVSGIIDVQQIQQIPGFVALLARTNAGGSASLVVQTTGDFIWIAVAGAGGQGLLGGNAGSVTTIGIQGGVAGAASHAANTMGGGGGGGRNYVGSPAPEGVGLGATPGVKMGTDYAFVYSNTQTGGGTGGDGYYGGGGDVNGGGGGSYVSPFCTQVESDPPPASNGFVDSSVTLTPASRVQQERLELNIYIWLTTYNILRITGGRGALMFSA